MIALLLMGIWTRSQMEPDTLCWSIGNRTQIVISNDGVVSWWRLATQRAQPFVWNTRIVNRTRDGSHIATIGNWVVELDASNSLSVPYWPFAVPLTLLSGYLILWKPRKKSALCHGRENDSIHSDAQPV